MVGRGGERGGKAAGACVNKHRHTVATTLLSICVFSFPVSTC